MRMQFYSLDFEGEGQLEELGADGIIIIISLKSAISGYWPDFAPQKDSS
jgi:hypothetical protein